MRFAIRLAAAAALALAACSDDHLVFAPTPLAHPVRVSGATPFFLGCTVPSPPGVVYPGTEVEPSLAVNPRTADHLVAAWQQDRWSDGGANGLLAAVSHDRGATWTATPLPFSRCAGGLAPNGDYQRATDPWVTFSADGALVHVIGFAFDATTARQAIVVSRSTDGGLSWSDPVAVASDTTADVALDKPTITADPVDPLRVYAVWDRLTGVTSPNAAAITGPAWFARSIDGGLTWTAPAVLYDPGSDAQTISSQIVALRDGTLLNVFVRITAMSTSQPSFEVVASASGDQGSSWSAPVRVGILLARGAFDPKSRHAIRAGEIVPSTAADAATGAVHVVWEDARFSGGAYDGIVLSSSTDGGRNWSEPTQVNGAPAVEAFRPAVAVGSDGTVAVTYYDFRSDAAVDPSHSWTIFWLATSADGGATWRESPAGGPFDLRTAPQTEDGWFLGDYTGLVGSAGGFVALFGMSGDSTDLFASQ